MKDANFLIENGIDVKSSLELFGDMDAYNETLSDFLESVDEKITNLENYKEVSDMGNYAIFVHSLKSDSKYLGFTKLAELAYSHEMQSKDGNVVYVYEHYDELIEEAKKMIRLAKEYLGREVKEEVKPVSTPKDKKILVVDDSDIIRNLITKMFDDEYEVLQACDGMEALQIIKDKKELFGMLLDLNMPNVNGFTVLECFKQNGLFAKIPVAIVTGDDTKETVTKAFTYPIVDVLNKPFNERDIKRVVTAMENFH